MCFIWIGTITEQWWLLNFVSFWFSVLVFGEQSILQWYFLRSLYTGWTSLPKRTISDETSLQWDCGTLGGLVKTVNVLPIRPIWFCRGFPFVPFTSFLGLWTEAFASFGSSRCLSESLGIFLGRRQDASGRLVPCFNFRKKGTMNPSTREGTLFLRSIKFSQKTSHEVSDI